VTSHTVASNIIKGNFFAVQYLVNCQAIENIDYIVGHLNTGIECYLRKIGDNHEILICYNSCYFRETESLNHFNLLCKRMCSQQLPRLELQSELLEFSLRDKIAKNFQELSSREVIYHSDGAYSYKELGGISERLSRKLDEDDNIVGIFATASIEFIAAVLACYANGVNFLAIDPRYGSSRIETILTSSKIRKLFYTDESEGSIPIGDFVKINISEYLHLNTGENLSFRVLGYSDRSVYRIYTSGSTGEPKGIDISEKNLSAFFSSYESMYQNIFFESWAFLSSVSFDASIKQYLGPLAFGGSIFIPKHDLKEHPLAVIEEINACGVSVLNVTPSLLSSLIDSSVDLSGFKYVFVGGEPLTQSLVDRLYKCVRDNPPSLINLYGPSETTINASYYEIDPLFKYLIMPIGIPLRHCSLFVVDDEKNVQQMGSEGKLVITGDIVSSGYSSDKQEGFFDIDGKPAYNTGDICFQWFDGLFYYKGREDSQVKVNGIRIDLNEVQLLINSVFPALLTHVFYYKGTIYLACLTASEQERREVLGWAQGRSLGFIKPQVIFVDHFPTTPGGKIDIATLLNKSKDVEVAGQSDNYLEAELNLLINLILSKRGRFPIGPKDILIDCGFDSLSILELTVDISLRYDIDIIPQDVMRHPTAHELSIYISERSVASNVRFIGNLESENIIILLPPVLGKSLIFNGLAQSIGRDACIITYDYPLNIDLKEGVDFFAKEVAENTMSQIKGKNIIVLGYSMGASAGFNLIKLLEQNDIETKKFIILDKEAKTRNSFDEQFKQNKEFLLEFLSGVPMSKGLHRALFNSIRTNTEVGINFKPDGQIHCSTTIFCCLTGDKIDASTWKPFIFGNINTDTLNCSHNQIFLKGNFDKVLEEIRSNFLKSAELDSLGLRGIYVKE
jgi:acyl-coenzyme A synthetase/AMP-(fatty) acid ligase/surfactin synthase thioesterase subunit/acyl carrier protein